MIIDAECDGLCLVYSLEDNAIEIKNIGGARTQIMTRGPFWLSTALDTRIHNSKPHFG